MCVCGGGYDCKVQTHLWFDSLSDLNTHTHIQTDLITHTLAKAHTEGITLSDNIPNVDNNQNDLRLRRSHL